MKKIILNEAQFTQIISEEIKSKDVKNMTFITYGLGDKFEPDKFIDHPQENAYRYELSNKPWFGLWASPLKKKGGSAWSEWVRSEMP